MGKRGRTFNSSLAKFHFAREDLPFFYLGKINMLYFIPNILTKNEKNSTTSSPSKWRPKLTIFQHFGALDGSEMAQVQNSSYEIEPTGGAQEYEHQRIGQLNFHCEQMLLYCELHHVKHADIMENRCMFPVEEAVAILSNSSFTIRYLAF